MIKTGHGIINRIYFIYAFLYFPNAYNEYVLLVKSEKILTLKRKERILDKQLFLGLAKLWHHQPQLLGSGRKRG